MAIILRLPERTYASPRATDPNPFKLEVVWQKPISSDTSEHYVNVHDASNDKVLYCVNLSSPYGYGTNQKC
ncbi:MAG: hypothetical protein IPL27_17060 [Lewinellaceae bacterium]|nr:hypothetical protein [Lewinellaceae bacterium]